MNTKLSPHGNALHTFRISILLKSKHNFLVNFKLYCEIIIGPLIFCNHCAGLQALHEITSSESYRLRVDLEDWEGNRAYAEYS